ncbi:MAG: ChaN family lipoprotein, partial [Flavobacterium sp.]|nr:ChaN family lipoprotein [Flavobacterium sp.]
YLTGMVSVSKLKSETKTWPNFKTDYLPLIQFSKEKNLSFIATNVPRRYASIVYQLGLDTLSFLSDEAKTYMAPLPILYDTSLSSYQEMLAMGMGHGGDNLPKSQALKDATMAYFILDNWKKGQTFIHFHGAFHSKNYEGINWYLKQENKRVRTVTISSYEQDDLGQLEKEQIGIADYIIVTPTNMTKTH